MSLIITRGFGRSFSSKDKIIIKEIEKLKNIYELPIVAEIEINEIVANVTISREAQANVNFRFDKK